MIILKKNDDFFSFKMHKIVTPIEESLIPYLALDITMEEGVTFKQFFNIILKHHEEYSELFSSYLGGVALSDFIKEWNSLIKRNYDNQGIENISIEWPDIYQLDNHPIDISYIPEFIGIGKKSGANNTSTYSLEFSPINKLKKYPLKLKENFNLYLDTREKQPIVFSKGFTVFDVLIAVFNEITFVGNPSQRQEELDKIKKRLDNFMSNPKAEKEKSISLEDFLKKHKIDLPKK